MRKVVLVGLMVLMAAGTAMAWGGGSESPKFRCEYVAPPATATGCRGVDTLSTSTGKYSYFAATWTIIHDTNTKGEVRLYDLHKANGVPTIRDSACVRLLPGLTYGAPYVFPNWDSILVTVWDVDDTCYVFGAGYDSDDTDRYGN